MRSDESPEDRTAREETGGAPGRIRTALKWLFLALLMGVISGLAAALFVGAVSLTTSGLLGGLVGHEPATTATGGAAHAATGFERAWALPLVTAGGALIASLITAWVAPETGGHGTDAAIDAAHERPTGIRSRVPVVKAITAALTLGSGGSGGTEGPIAQIGGALGSGLSRRTGLSGRQARTMVMAGLGSGIAAVFRAPLGGAFLAAELLYVRGSALEILVPAVLASAVAYGVIEVIHGPGSLFGDLSVGMVSSPRDLVSFAVLGLICGLVGRVYSRSFYGISGLTARCVRRPPGRRALPVWLPPALGGLAVGFLGLAVPEVLGTGYGTIQQLLTPEAVGQMSLWLVLLLPLAKIAATSLSIGTGGSGGIFGPGLLIGAATGVATWRGASALGIPLADPRVFAIIGMAVCLGAIIHAPVGVTILVLESTRSPGLILPIVVAMAVAMLVVGDQTLYRSQRHAGGYRITDPLRALRSAWTRRTRAHSKRRPTSVRQARRDGSGGRVSEGRPEEPAGHGDMTRK